MKVTKKSNGEVYNAEMVGGKLAHEGGLWHLDDPEFPARNGNQLQEQYLMGEVRVVEPKSGEPARPAAGEAPARVIAVPPPDFMKAPVAESPPDEKKVELPKKAKGWPKGKKRGKARRDNQSPE